MPIHFTPFGTYIPIQWTPNGTKKPNPLTFSGTKKPSQVTSSGTKKPSQLTSNGTEIVSHVTSCGTKKPSTLLPSGTKPLRHVSPSDTKKPSERISGNSFNHTSKIKTEETVKPITRPYHELTTPSNKVDANFTLLPSEVMGVNGAQSGKNINSISDGLGRKLSNRMWTLTLFRLRFFGIPGPKEECFKFPHPYTWNYWRYFAQNHLFKTCTVFFSRISS